MTLEEFTEMLSEAHRWLRQTGWHAAGSVTGRYTHQLDAVLTAAADKVAATIYAMMNAKLEQTTQAEQNGSEAQTLGIAA